MRRALFLLGLLAASSGCGDPMPTDAEVARDAGPHMDGGPSASTDAGPDVDGGATDAGTDAAPASCGDGTCSPAEACRCEADCGPRTCGDGLCCPDDGETATSCLDCSCGDGRCDPALEDGATCAADCDCGDGVCHADDGETRATCPDDCGPAFDALDWLVQDRVRADPAVDPYCVPNGERDEQGAYDPLRFIRVDTAGRQNFTSFRVRAFHDQTRWTDRAMTTFDFPPYLETQEVSAAPFSSGGDTMESDGPLVSIVGTNDGSGMNGWFNNTGAHGCSYGDAWVLYDERDVSESPGGGVVEFGEELRTAIRGVAPPSTTNCPTASGTSRTRWTLIPDYAFAAASTCTSEAHKRMPTIVSDHGPGNLSHHEVFYLTDEYGFTRWERWNCSPTRQLTPPSPDYAALRCNYAESESAMHMAYPVPEAPDQGWQIQNREGLYCVLVDCRDATTLVPIDDPAGWLPAGWRPAAQVYYTGNVLLNGDFVWSEDTIPNWTTQGTMTASPIEAADGGHSTRLQTTSAGRGWFSQTADLTDFFSALGAGRGTAGPMRVRFGVRAWSETASRRSLQVALVQWNAALTENLGIHTETVDVGPETSLFHGEVALDPRTERVQLRLSLAAGPGPSVQVDDVFAMIADAP